MPLDIVDKFGKLLENQNLTPKCENLNPGQGDFCDRCGDCLVCHNEDKCYSCTSKSGWEQVRVITPGILGPPFIQSEDGKHIWVIEED